VAKFFVLCLLALLLVPQTALADDSCITQISAIKSFIDARAPGITELVPPKYDSANRTVTHQVKLKNGTVVNLSLGGCAHYAYTLTFTEVKGLRPDLSQEEIIKIIGENLTLLPTDTRFHFSDIAAKILDARNWRLDRMIECGDAICLLDIKDQSFVFSYDFAL
jgi:hypothetical protein